jgi:hypothetical protein
MNFKSFTYKALKLSNDASAVKKQRVPRRVGRRVYGKVSGSIARRLFG